MGAVWFYRLCQLLRPCCQVDFKFQTNYTRIHGRARTTLLDITHKQYSRAGVWKHHMLIDKN